MIMLEGKKRVKEKEIVKEKGGYSFEKFPF
jgi:hypothetical protein